jgi:hypothetical protein
MGNNKTDTLQRLKTQMKECGNPIQSAYNLNIVKQEQKNNITKRGKI